MDLSEVTLVIPTHNRNGYLKRILDYYSSVLIRVIVVDSTSQPYSGLIDTKRVVYNHYPDMPMPQKIKQALNQVKTKFVVMCADDDFVIPEAINACVIFLNENKFFVAAQGNTISYKKQNNYDSYIELNPMYLNQLNFEIVDENPFKRLQKLFHPYRTIFSAVHYTKTLRKAFQNLDTNIKNLYLNEYLTAIIPILSGAYKELNIFYQAREFSWRSDDKTTDNFDIILFNPRYETELNSYLTYVVNIASEITNANLEDCSKTIHEILFSFSKQIAIDKQNMRRLSFSKRIGKLITLLPFFGERIVLSRRLKKQRRDIVHVVKTPDEKRQLDQVINCIKIFATTVN